MHLSAIDRLREAFTALREALDGDDVAAIDAATRQAGEAVAAVRDGDAWREEPALKDKLIALLPLIEASRVRTAVLGDQAAQRLAMLAARGAGAAPLTYRR